MDEQKMSKIVGSMLKFESLYGTEKGVLYFAVRKLKIIVS